MTYQALARKWRPPDFSSLVGQDHAVKAIRYALTTQRLHQTYLLTGTRGVGKTTLARLIAKGLNCEQGIGDAVCNRCTACLGIEQGHYPDYLELDAASHRSVEDISPLLETVCYAPTAGRYRVYVIDEVHMLSAHAFNAMLKTLEEPPAHAVFILATTDPQRVPVTILSRCFQLKLKCVPAPIIAQHLQTVLTAEAIAFDDDALLPLAKAAAGSVRDALSLLEQAIAVGAGEVRGPTVCAMLGIVRDEVLHDILGALARFDGPILVQLAETVFQQNLSAERLLADLSVLFQRMACAQFGALPVDPTWKAFLDTFAPEEIQVCYQILTAGLRDLPLAPDHCTGLIMVLLRLMAFRPASENPLTHPSVRTGIPPENPEIKASSPSVRLPNTAPPMQVHTPFEAQHHPLPAAPEGVDWATLVRKMDACGMATQFMRESVLVRSEESLLVIRVPSPLWTEQRLVTRVTSLISKELGRPVKLKIEVGPVQTGATVGEQIVKQEQAVMEKIQRSIHENLFVNTLVKRSKGAVVPESIRPADPGKAAKANEKETPARQ